ncbi:dephospho-CoA kinase [Oenococcus alcoholitolerans]|uniref:dephospho-CoA kinase n=1 Tax=Oenococcus alcoholitolerans TaxID=931074 RepID=UPI003F700351
MSKMIKVGITGGIGSGKTSVSNIFARLGFKVVDADKIAREIVLPGRWELEEIKNAFGLGVMNGSNLDRHKLGKIVFSDQQALRKLNEIIQPSIKQTIEMRGDFLQKEGLTNTLVYDIPLLFEHGYQDIFDFIILVYADEKTRIERIVKRDDISRQEAFNRISSQMPLDEKKKMSDIVIDNSKIDLPALESEVERIISEKHLQP